MAAATRFRRRRRETCRSWGQPAVYSEAEIIVPETARDRHSVRVAAMRELYTVLEILNAPDDLLGIVGKWVDTMDDGAALQNLRTAFDQGGGTIVAKVVGQFE